MTDGHTKKGSYPVTLELTGDMVEQLTRLIDMAKMMDSHNIPSPNKTETFDVIAYRAFLKEILQILYKALKDKEVL